MDKAYALSSRLDKLKAKVEAKLPPKGEGVPPLAPTNSEVRGKKVLRGVAVRCSRPDSGLPTDHIQFDTVYELHTAYSTTYLASPVSIPAHVLIGKDKSKPTLPIVRRTIPGLRSLLVVF